MNDNTRQDLFWVVSCLQAISFNDDLTMEEEEAVYNLYGAVKSEVKELVDLSDYDPEKLM